MFKMFKLIIFLIISINVIRKINSIESSGSTSYNSLVATQCRARCLSLYPWKTLSNNNNTFLERKHRSNLFRFRRAFSSSVNNNSGILSVDSNQHNKHPPHNVKWHKVMEMCSKNTNCLQCSMPCDIPTNLLPNCKYLCKNQNSLCIESCNLLNKLNDEKHGSCPNFDQKNNECNAFSSKLTWQTQALRHNNEDSNLNEKTLNECDKDADCFDMRKCCSLNPKCPEQKKVCLKPQIINQNLPSIPFNLTIVERKKGKTVILSWNCNYNKNKPTIFVVEGRWSLKPPQTTDLLGSVDSVSSSSSDPDNYMTKWGYLAQSANNNWVILRNINRGRWYKFRVAAISKSGTYGYSKPTELFILSSAPKPPSEPQNLTVLQVHQSSISSINDDKHVNVDLGWLPPKRSDLPILNYKITWKRKATLNNKNQTNVFDYESDESADSSSSDSASSSSSHISASFNTVNTAEYGSEIIDSSSSKHTIKNLNRYSIYSIEIVAISNYDKDLLISIAQRVRLDTSNYYPSIGFESPSSSASSLLVADQSHKVSQQQQPSQDELNENEDNTDEDDDEEDDDEEDDNLEKTNQQHTSERNQRLISENSNDLKRILIRNLSINSPYFQNGLVKTKLSWQIEDNNNNNMNNEAKQTNEVSINLIIDQPMFTITWFAIKCVSNVKTVGGGASEQQKQLPTPITATTINTNFEIYELKYNCDYVVNVRLSNNNNNNKQQNENKATSSSLNRPAQPQIASAQFKVPSCNQIKIVGRIRPICYTADSTNTETQQQQQSIDLYQYLLPNEQTTQSTTSSTSTTSSSTTTFFSTKSINQLPRVFNLRHKVIEKKNLNNKFSAVEFTWSLPYLFNKNNFNGYQISVVPKAIPGMNQQQQNFDEDFVSYGSVGAIVDKEQQSFVVRQLSSSIKYIFQIQLIGLDNQSYGPAASLEFIINDQLDDFKHHQSSMYQTKKAISLHQNSRTDYDINSYDINDSTNTNNNDNPTSSPKTNQEADDEFSSASSAFNVKYFLAVFLILISMTIISI